MRLLRAVGHPLRILLATAVLSAFLLLALFVTEAEARGTLVARAQLPVEKITVSLPPDVVAYADRKARAEGTSRSR